MLLGDDDYKGHRKWVHVFLKRAYHNLVAKMSQSQILAEEGVKVLMEQRLIRLQNGVVPGA